MEGGLLHVANFFPINIFVYEMFLKDCSGIDFATSAASHVTSMKEVPIALLIPDAYLRSWEIKDLNYYILIRLGNRVLH